MKKIFKKIDIKSDAAIGIRENTSFIGKTFHIGKTSVVVEDVLAEGMRRYFIAIAT